MNAHAAAFLEARRQLVEDPVAQRFLQLRVACATNLDARVRIDDGSGDRHTPVGFDDVDAAAHLVDVLLLR